MRQVCQRNNPNKNPNLLTYAPCYRHLSVYNPSCKKHNKLLISILIILLVWPINLGMCPDVHLNTHISIYKQGEWLLETDKNWWTIFIVGPAFVLDDDLLLLFLLGNYITPGHVSPNLGIKTQNTNRQFCDHYKHNITPVSICSSHPDVSCPFYSLLEIINYGNEQEHVRCIMSTCCTGKDQYMSGYLVIIPISDNYKSGMPCKIVKC